MSRRTQNLFEWTRAYGVDRRKARRMRRRFARQTGRPTRRQSAAGGAKG